jgi:hypothetical protein
MEGKMAEYLIGVEVHNSDQISSRPHSLLIGLPSWHRPVWR